MPVLSLGGLPFYPHVSRFVIAYSGGLDSHVLLHKLAALRDTLAPRELIALHINHGLSAKADQWTAHCRARCEALGVAFANIDVEARHATGESPEAAARDARYRAIAGFLQAGDCLLTAHHQDDQAETLLIQLLRGAGPRGLAAMPVYTEFAAGWHARPLLDFSREQLHRYAQQHGLSWIDDASNSDTRFDRNFLRHEIMPVLKSRFPAMASTLSRSAGLCAEAADLLVAVATADTRTVERDDGALSVSGLKALGEVRARNLLHQYCRDRGLPTPTARQLQCIWNEVIGAAADSEPLVAWPGAEARRYRDGLYLGTPLPAHDAGLVLSWDGERALAIEGLGVLRGERLQGQGIACAALAGRPLSVRFRRGGETLQPAGRAGHHTLKKLFQEAGVPPWGRERIPLLYADDELLAVAGYWVAQAVAAREEEMGLRLSWEAQE
ncbi:MAG TPA: tRNA lysidine(34) synthetase TilS [Gammaproteobacteria bacterium]|nr:tRNA lysidine(34) synthetase TilS [Gammaproteobacteria bacterium]